MTAEDRPRSWASPERRAENEAWVAQRNRLHAERQAAVLEAVTDRSPRSEAELADLRRRLAKLEESSGFEVFPVVDLDEGVS